MHDPYGSIVQKPPYLWDNLTRTAIVPAEYLLATAFAFQTAGLFLLQAYWSHLARNWQLKPFMRSKEFYAYMLWTAFTIALFPTLQWIYRADAIMSDVVPELAFACEWAIVCVLAIRSHFRLSSTIPATTTKHNRGTVLRIQYFISMNRIQIFSTGVTAAAFGVLCVDALSSGKYLNKHLFTSDFLIANANWGGIMTWIIMILIVYPRWYLYGLHGSSYANENDQHHSAKAPSIMETRTPSVHDVADMSSPQLPSPSYARRFNIPKAGGDTMDSRHTSTSLSEFPPPPSRQRQHRQEGVSLFDKAMSFGTLSRNHSRAPSVISEQPSERQSVRKGSYDTQSSSIPSDPPKRFRPTSHHVAESVSSMMTLQQKTMDRFKFKDGTKAALFNNAKAMQEDDTTTNAGVSEYAYTDSVWDGAGNNHQTWDDVVKASQQRNFPRPPPTDVDTLADEDRIMQPPPRGPLGFLNVDPMSGRSRPPMPPSQVIIGANHGGEQLKHRQGFQNPLSPPPFRTTSVRDPLDTTTIQARFDREHA